MVAGQQGIVCPKRSCFAIFVGVNFQSHRRRRRSIGSHDTDLQLADPVVQLGIKGRDKDGWYPVSKILVTEEPAPRKTIPDFSKLKEGIRLSGPHGTWGAIR